ncbi:MAG: response regulator [Planctomycetota bacterium]|jgi:DNA-binding NarL/FixJ family response regulator
MACINALLIEDSSIVRHRIAAILQDGSEPELFLDAAESLGDGLAAMKETRFDVVLLDLGLPDSEGLETLQRFRKAQPEVAVVVLTGTMGDSESALEGIRQGAQDYLNKEVAAQPQVLRRALLYAIERGRLQREQEHLIHQLQEALENIKTLKGLLPICGACHKVRDDEGYWQQIESYISDHSDAQFSHTLCNDCLKERHPNLYDRVMAEVGKSKQQ